MTEPYIIPLGSLKGRPITSVNLEFLQQAVAMRIQPVGLYVACIAELVRRGEHVPDASPPSKPDAFKVGPERNINHIPDSLGEIAADSREAGRRHPDQPPSHPVVSSGGPKAASASSSESLPLPCGHPTSDLGWDDNHIKTACLACLHIECYSDRIRALAKRGDEVELDAVLLELEMAARKEGWPHNG